MNQIYNPNEIMNCYRYDIIQGMDEWHEARRGRMTASKASAIRAQGKGLDTLCYELASQRLSTGWDPYGGYLSEDMLAGIENEGQARDLYRRITGATVAEVGFVDLNAYVGCSPDGLVGDDGLIEIKCPSDKVYLQYLVERDIDTKYMAQMQMQMLVCRRAWCDYVVYNPNYKKRMVIQRVERDIDAQQKIYAGLLVGYKIMQEIVDKYHSYNGGIEE